MDLRKRELRRHAFAKLRRQFRRGGWLLIEAVFWLGLARFTILVIPFRWLTGMLSFRSIDQGAGNHTFCKTSRAFSRRASRALRLAANYTAWDSNCLTLAVAGACMLRCRQIAATLAMGVIKNPAKAGGLEAHAWLYHGGIILTGATEHVKFNVVAKFTYGANSPASGHECIDTRRSL
jgi:hypothetical protein